MQNLKDNLVALIQGTEYVADGKPLKNKLTEDALKHEAPLIRLLLKDAQIKKHFFVEVDDKILVFDEDKFVQFVNDKEFLPDSFTAFRNKIGLMDSRGKYFREINDVVLAWPYKDCVLEGGQDKEDEKRNEIFYNETLAPDEIDRLLDPKVLTNFKHYSADGVEELTPSVLRTSPPYEGGEKSKGSQTSPPYEGEEKGAPKTSPPYEGGEKSKGSQTSPSYEGEEKGAPKTSPPLQGGVARSAEGVLTDQNLIIKGNNLLALHSLKKLYRGKVKLIYIDPPYNTGNDGFNYNDKFNHSSWLTFMKNRLEIAKSLLSDDGSIWINIDDDEAHYLKVLCDDVFGRENFIGTVVWEKSDSPRMDATYFSVRHDYILVYGKNKELVEIKRILKEEIPEHYNKRDGKNKLYYLKPLRVMGGNISDSLYFPLVAPDGTEVLPKEKNGTHVCNHVLSCLHLGLWHTLPWVGDPCH